MSKVQLFEHNVSTDLTAYIKVTRQHNISVMVFMSNNAVNGN